MFKNFASHLRLGFRNERLINEGQKKSHNSRTNNAREKIRRPKQLAQAEKKKTDKTSLGESTAFLGTSKQPYPIIFRLISIVASLERFVPFRVDDVAEQGSRLSSEPLHVFGYFATFPLRRPFAIASSHFSCVAGGSSLAFFAALISAGKIRFFAVRSPPYLRQRLLQKNDAFKGRFFLDFFLAVRSPQTTNSRAIFTARVFTLVKRQ